MNTYASSAQTATRASLGSTAATRAQLAAFAGAVCAVAFTAVTLTATITSDGGDFRGAGDYWYTGIGMIPSMAAALVLVQALHALQQGSDGRRGRAGSALMMAGLAVFVAMGVLGLIVGRATSLGPTYLLASIATIVGLGLFAAGSWSSGVLPRSLLAAWVVAWTVGGPFAQAAAPLLLACVYALIGVLVRRRSDLQ